MDENYITDVDENGKYDVKDFLNLENSEIIDMNKGHKFSAIIMNPPFSGDLHLDFFDKCLDVLSEDGQMVIVEPGQWLVQLKDNAKYTRENSLTEKIKNKIKNHIKSIDLNNYNTEFGIANKTAISITSIDYSKDYKTIDFNCCGEKHNVETIYDCNLIGDYKLIKSILNKCKNYKDLMIDHCINAGKYQDYENKGYWFLPYANYMINNLGTMQTHRFTNAFHYKTKNIDTLNSYFAVFGSYKENELTYNFVKKGVKSGSPCDSVYGSKNELENWQYFIYNNKLPLFIGICLTIDEHNNSREYTPWLVNKKYTDEEIYKLLNITKEEQELINKTIKNFDLHSPFGKQYFGQ